MPKVAVFFRFCSQLEYRQWIKKSDCVVTHGGAGTVVAARLERKPIVVFPRMAALGETNDDMFLDLARALERERLALVVMDREALARTVSRKEYAALQHKEVSMRLARVVASMTSDS